MIICHDPKFVYYAPPKTGTRSLGDMLIQQGFIPNQVGKHEVTDETLCGVTDEYFHFITVRNPMSRMVSMYKHMQQKTFPAGLWPPDQQRLHNLAKRMGLHQFVLDVDWEESKCADFFAPQSVYFDAMSKCNKIVRLESFAEDLKDLPFLSLPDHIPHRNHRVDVWQEYYYKFRTEEVVDKVAQYYASDFLNFEYSPESWRELL